MAPFIADEEIPLTQPTIGTLNEHGPNRSRLRSCSGDTVFDLVCVGFGPASLSIAIALHEALDSQKRIPDLEQMHSRPPKVLFLEKQSTFTWHEGMLLPGAKMQISFLKDLVTLRNPKSDFTFLNYLQENDRLVQFCNLGTFLPSRLEYQDYMKWCADWFTEVVMYNQEVTRIEPRYDSDKSKVNEFQIYTKDARPTAETTSAILAKRIVIAAGGTPWIPSVFDSNCSSIVHSSRYLGDISNVLPDPSAMYRIAVIGGGQSAAEIFNDLHSRFPYAKTSLILKNRALRPSDDSPFVNEIFDPSAVDTTFSTAPDLREASISEDRNTNYGVVRIDLLEHLYAKLYEQRITELQEENWQHRIIPNTTVEEASVHESKVHLSLRAAVPESDAKTGQHREQNDDTAHVCDAVIVATGYTRDTHKMIFSSAVEELMPADAQWTVERDYSVRFKPGALAKDAGVWLQGCNEETHGLSDTLLSILATRAGEMVLSLFGNAP